MAVKDCKAILREIRKQINRLPDCQTCKSWGKCPKETRVVLGTIQMACSARVKDMIDKIKKIEKDTSKDVKKIKVKKGRNNG